MTKTTDFSLGISPCPNDTFMFYHFLHKSQFALEDNITLNIADVEELNQLSLTETLDFSKVSFHLYGKVRKNYIMLSAGAALGFGCGPLLISKDELSSEELTGKTIAIPGENTTAVLLLKCFLAEQKVNFKTMIFSDIMPAIQNGEVDAGLIIHESRFTYKNFDLKLIQDLGEWWESETQLPIPLGGIIAKRDQPVEKLLAIDKALKESVLYAQTTVWKDNPEFSDFVKKYAQEIDADVLDQHIKTYVNEESAKLSQDARSAIRELFRIAEEKGLIEVSNETLFVDEI